MVLVETCLAMAIYFEARGEPLAGQLAVAQVIINRVASPRYPNTPCEVIQQGPVYPSGHPVKHRCQFSFWCDGRPEVVADNAAWHTALLVAAAAKGSALDITEGATFYHATNVSPRWRYTMKVTVQIGSHIFYTPKVSATLTGENK